MNARRRVFATVPIELEFPDAMAADIAEVLKGEYEAGYDGEGLSILDIGANVGAFSIWASLRWPNSLIHAYEPNPDTFEMLARNVGRFTNVSCHEVAVYPGGTKEMMMYSRYPGDGEAGLIEYAANTYSELRQDRMVKVSVLDPGELPRCDVLKADVEGGEAAILEAMDLSTVSLIVLEYQDMRNRRSIEKLLAADFECEFVDSFPWSRILSKTEHRPELSEDSYGHMFFVNRHSNRLRKTSAARATQAARWPVEPDKLSLRQVLTAMPGAAKRTIASRLRRPR